MGGSLPGLFLGIGWAGGAEISMLPHAEGSVIGFDDVRVERLSGNHTLDRLLGPLLAAAAPHQFKVDARALINKMLLATSARSGTSIALDRFTITGMQIQGQALLLDIDGTVTIQ